MKKNNKKYKDPRLNALIDKPEEIVPLKSESTPSVLVKFGKREQKALEVQLTYCEAQSQ